MSPVRGVLLSCLALLGLLTLIPSTTAQLIAANCTDTAYAWTFNSLQQAPCLVAAYLQSVCNGGFAIVPQLPRGAQYSGPTRDQGGDFCMCNTVVYNLLSACDACQGESWVQWSQYEANCSSTIAPGTISFNVPDNTRVPQWAYLDPTQSNNTWDNATAFRVGDGVESTATPAPTIVNPSPTSGQSTIANAFSQSSSSTSTTTDVPVTSDTSGSNSGTPSHAGAIAGGTVGGVVGVAALAGLAFFVFRRRATRIPLLPKHANETGNDGPTRDGEAKGRWDPLEGPSVGSDTDTTPMKYYDPDDPSTFPSTPLPSSASRTIRTTEVPESSEKGGATTIPVSATNNSYSGLPMV